MRNILTATFCIFLFSLTVPFTRLAALQTSPESILILRIFGAGFLCLVLAILDRWIPPRDSWKGILSVSLGSVIGYSTFTAFAMRDVPSGHASVALAGLPLVTTVYSVLRDKLNPGLRFWLYASVGTLLSFGFFLSLSIDHIVSSDFLLILAVFSAAFGYVEGGRASRKYGGRRIMMWGILSAIPLLIPVVIHLMGDLIISMKVLTLNSWLSIGYLAFISQSVGMFLWFKVLAIGPMEQVALIQLLQPFFSLAASSLILQEKVLTSTWLIAILVVVSIFGVFREKKLTPKRIG